MNFFFNLIDEPWIPVADIGKVSLREIFTNIQYRALGGSPVQKIALMKLLLAIAQSASTPDDDQEWESSGWQGMSQCCLGYLEKWHDHFYLYGPKPFLQMPSIDKASIQSYGAVLPEVSTGNTTILTQSQIERDLNDAEKALLLVSLMAFALGGKKTDNRIVLADGYRGKSKAGKPGPAVAHGGLLHNFCLGESVLQTLWLNLLTQSDIYNCGYYPMGLGVAPWQDMPVSEDCKIARGLKNSLMGRLIPICRFCFLTDDGLHYSEGLAHKSYLEGGVDPSVAVNFSPKKPKVLWVKPEKRPWRELTALLGFFQQGSGFDCLQLSTCVKRAAHNTEVFAVWSGGLKITYNAGEQYVSGVDDFVESIVWLVSSELGDVWFQQFKTEIEELEKMAKVLSDSTVAYYKQQLTDGIKHAAQVSNLFWQLCERDIQLLVDSCAMTDSNGAAHQQRRRLRRNFANYAYRAFDQFCPQATARQLEAWAKCRPNFFKTFKTRGRMSEEITTSAGELANKPNNRASRFVEGTIKRCLQDKGLAARLRRADNLSTEYQSWDLLSAFGVNLENGFERLPYTTVSAAIAKAKIEHNGGLKLGEAIARCYSGGGKNDNESSQAQARLRRLLACDNTEEACRILRTLFSLIRSKVNQPLDYAHLLNQLLKLHRNPEQIKSQWAQEFYSYKIKNSARGTT